MNDHLKALKFFLTEINALLHDSIATEAQCEELSTLSDCLHNIAESAWNKRLASQDTEVV